MARRSRTSVSSHSPTTADEVAGSGVSVRASTSHRLSGPEEAEQVVDLVGVAGAAAVGEALELELEVGEHDRVEQLAQLLGAEQLAQQVAVEGQRRGPALGQRGVALVHVDGDPAEQQRLGERRGPGRVDRDHAHLARPQVGEDLAQRGQVEHVVEALPGGLEQDREVGVAGRDRAAGRRPSGAAATAGCADRAGGGAAAGPGPRTRGSGRRTWRCWAAGR